MIRTPTATGLQLAHAEWLGKATCELSVEVLAAVSSANTAASDDDPTEVAGQLTTAGWSQPHPPERK